MADDALVNILVVDDEPNNLFVMEAVLEGLGKIHRARTGQEAIRHVLQKDFAVILLDVNMPGMDGFETGRLIRQRPRSEDVPLIFCTASYAEQDIREGYTLGAVDYLIKPIVPEIVRSKVRVFVELRKSVQLREQADRLRRMHAELERLVAERTAELAAANESLRERTRVAEFASAVGMAIIQPGQLRDALGRCAECAVDHLNAAFAGIWIYNEKEQMLELEAKAGIDTPPNAAHVRVSVGQFKVGWIASQRLPYYTNDVSNDPPVGDEGWARREGLVSFAGCPLLIDGRLKGVMALLSRQPLSQKALQGLSGVADRIAAVIDRSQALDMLAESETRQALLLRSLPVAFYAAKPSEHCTTWISENVATISGFEPARFTEEPSFWARRIHPEDRERVFAEIGEPLSQGGYTVEYRWRCADDRYQWFLDQAVLVDDADGSIAEFVGTWLNVTERKESEEANRQQARKLQEQAQLLELAQVLIREPSGKIIFWNARAADLYGWSREEALGKYAHELLRTVAPRPLAEIEADLLRDGRWEGELQYATRDGRNVEVACTSVLQRDAEGLPEAVLEVHNNITELKEAQDALRRLNAELEGRVRDRTADLAHQTSLLRSVVKNMAEGLVVVDPDGRPILCNPAARRMIGDGPEERDARLWSERYDLYLPDGVTPYPPDQLPLARALRGEEVNDVDVFIRPPGKQRGSWASCVARPFCDDEGKNLGGLVVFRDVTPRKAMEADLLRAKHEAEKANRAKSEFLSRMSHELRTPLNGVLGFAQLLQRSASLSTKQRRQADHIFKAGRHLLDLVNEVLDIARIEAGNMALSAEPVLVETALAESLAILQPLAGEYGVHIKTLPLERDWFVQVDNQRLKQILLNLISNAVKYNRPGGTVTLSACEQPDGRLRLAVADNGLGIAAEKLEHLFEPFNRLGAERSAVEGTGLGLALTERLTNAMGGSLTVSSEEGVGSTFTVDLPRANPPRQRPVAREQEASTPAGIPSLTLLYIEDNPANLQLVEDILTDCPSVRLLTAMQARLGLDLARQHRPGLILLDVHLPDFPGDEFLRRMAADPMIRDIPVVILSADATVSQSERLRSLGVCEYLTKPLDVARFLEVINASLAKGDEA